MKSVNGKPGHMTSLSGNLLVPKTHGRIVFRGLIDTLEAEVIETQALAALSGASRGAVDSGAADADILNGLGEILAFLRSLMAAEVTEMPLSPPFLFGLDAGELHRQSHDIAGTFGVSVPLPDYTQGPLAARLNTLRAKTREVELFAVKVFGPGLRADADCSAEQRDDIVLALNRLSSALWWLFCRYVSAKQSSPENAEDVRSG